MRKVFGFICALFLAVLFLFPSTSFAQVAKSGSAVTIEKNQTVNGDFFAGGQTVAIHGTINGDLYIGGGSVQVDGTINGDILVAGGTLLLQGSAHNIRAAGGNITIDSSTDGNVTAVGGNITISDGAKIAGSLVSAGGQVSVLGPIGKGATLAGGQVTVGNSVGGDILAAGNVTLTSNAKVNGNLTYWSNQKATIENGAMVAGTVMQNIPPKSQQPKQQQSASAAGLVGASFMFALVSLVSSFILGFLFLQLVPLFTLQVVETIRERVWLSLGIGVLVFIVTPIVAFILLLTVLGIPLAFLLMVLYGIYAYISKIFVALAIGIWIFERNNPRKPHVVWALVVGLIIYEILGVIPFIGWLVGLVFWLIGMGALFITKREVYFTLRGKKLI